MHLAPDQTQGVTFQLPLTGTEGCSNASCNVHFAWSVRQPYPRAEPLVEFFNERQGAHASLGAGNAGQAVKGFYSPLTVSNRSLERVLVEIRFVFTSKE